MRPGQCVQSTYPEDFVAACLVVQRKWAFNPNSSRCEGISYSPCGQEREGYNVFDTEGECNRTCVRAEGKQSVIDIKSTLIDMHVHIKILYSVASATISRTSLLPRPASSTHGTFLSIFGCVGLNTRLLLTFFSFFAVIF